MMQCPLCSNDIRDDAVICEHCVRDLHAPQPTPSGPVAGRTAKRFGAVDVIVFALGVACMLAAAGASLIDRRAPTVLTRAHGEIVQRALDAKGYRRPNRLVLEAGRVVVATYDVPDDLDVPHRSFAEDQLLVIHEALRPFGFTEYRVDLNGRVDTGIVRRHGSARLLDGDGQPAWSTAPAGAPTRELVFLTREGCDTAATMRANLDIALQRLGWPTQYQFIDAGTLPASDPRGRYATPTILVTDRDLFGASEPSPHAPGT
jgi:hypothetical protein